MLSSYSFEFSSTFQKKVKRENEKNLCCIFLLIFSVWIAAGCSQSDETADMVTTQKVKEEIEEAATTTASLTQQEMKAKNLPDIVIENFKFYYDQLAEGETGLISETDRAYF